MKHESTGRIESIHIAAEPGGALQTLDLATLIAGRGIEGDRCCAADVPGDGPKFDAQVSLVEAEQIESFAQAAGFGLEARHTRRNIVTRGVSLNALVGQVFSIGAVELRGVELAEPCAYLAGRLIKQFDLADVEPKDIVAGLTHRGGLYATILRGGTIRPGDPIVEES
jgi:MOSC domain-containing protein YiiM